MSRVEVITQPAAEPVTLAEAKKQVELGSGSEHDDQLNLDIAAARQQWEHDIQTSLIKRTLRWTVDSFDEYQFADSPVSAITSIVYYDANNSQQTLPTSVYQLDEANNRLMLAYSQSWPTVASRWDAVQITFVAGRHDGASTVGQIHKRAMLLLIGHYFENRDMLLGGTMGDQRAYESIVRKMMRGIYP